MFSRLFSIIGAVLCLIGLSGCVETSDSSAGSARVAVVDLQLESADAVNLRRDALAPIPMPGVVLFDSAAMDPEKYIDLKQSYWVDPAETDTVVIRLQHPDAAAGGKHTIASVASSDENVATLLSNNSDEIAVKLSGKLGNSYITLYGENGDAIEKVMILAATPRADVGIVDTNTFEPTLLTFNGSKATDFKSSPDFTVLDRTLERYTGPTDSNPNRFNIRKTKGGKFDVRDLFKNKTDLQKIKALYFPKQDLLIELNPGESFKSTLFVNDDLVLKINSLVAQNRWKDFMDDGGTITPSPLRDPEKPIEASMSALYNPNENYAGFEKPKCENKSGYGGELNFNSSLMRVVVKFGGEMNWNNGAPSVGLKVHPLFTAGGEFAMTLSGSAKLGMACKLKLFDVPLYEFGIPLLGKVKFQVPINLGFQVVAKASAQGRVTAMLPRLEIGSEADTKKPGTVGIRYQFGKGFDSEKDLTTKVFMDNIGFVQLSSKVKGSLDVRAGVSAGMELNAKINLWFSSIEVSAEIGDVLFGGKFVPDFEIKSVNGKTRFDMDLKDGIMLGIFPTISPTIKIKILFFTVSFNLFEIEAGEIIIAKGFGKTGKIENAPMLLGNFGYRYDSRIEWERTSSCNGFRNENGKGVGMVLSDRWTFERQNPDLTLVSGKLRIFRASDNAVLWESILVPNSKGNFDVNMTGVDINKLANGHMALHSFELQVKGDNQTCNGVQHGEPWPSFDN